MRPQPLLALALAGFLTTPSAASAQVPPPGDNPGAGDPFVFPNGPPPLRADLNPQLVNARPCRADELAIDVSWYAPSLPGSRTPAGTALRALLTRVRDDMNPWVAPNTHLLFCPDGDCAAADISLNSARVVVSRPLANRTALRGAGHADAHYRFIRVRFQAQNGAGKYKNVALRSDAQAAALARLRISVDSALGLDLGPSAATQVLPLYVGGDGFLTSIRPPPNPNLPEPLSGRAMVYRECEVSGGNLEGRPSDEMLTWHYAQISGDGAPRGAVTPAELPAGLPLFDSSGFASADIALVDTAVDRTVAAALGITTRFGSSSPNQAHGSIMALLLRQMAPWAVIRSYTALGNAGYAPITKTGYGTITTAARAVDAALFDSALLSPEEPWPGRRPLVVNLSLGFPPELSLTSWLTGNGAVALEDGAGEMLRFVLLEARVRDSRGAPTLVVASTGNRLREGLDTSTFVLAGFADPPRDQCGNDFVEAAEPTWFFPAGWGRYAACPGFDIQSGPLALGVSATDALDGRASVSFGNPEAALVAPGEKIAVDLPGVARTATVDTCTTDGRPAPRPQTGVRLPSLSSGTSNAAALVSGVAADSFRSAAAMGLPLDSGDAIRRLLYVGGQDVCRDTPSQAPVRRLSLPGLSRALLCPGLSACLDSYDDGTGLEVSGAGKTLLDACNDLLAACGLSDPAHPIVGEFRPLCPQASYVPVEPPADYEVAAGVTCNVAYTPSATAGGCPGDDCPEQPALATAGPQPDIPLCPDCLLHKTGATWTLKGTVNSRLTSTSRVRNPRIFLGGPEGTATVAVTTPTCDSATCSWVAGTPIKITGISLPTAATLSWTGTTGARSLVVNLSTTTSAWADNHSTLGMAGTLP